MNNSDFVFYHPLIESVYLARSTEGSSGYDLRSSSIRPVVILSNEVQLIPCGFRLEMTKGMEAQIRSRSGLALEKRVVVFNSPGTIDSDYRGEIKVILYNAGLLPFTVNYLDRIAQLVFAPVYTREPLKSKALHCTAREAAGFGSTGVK